MLRLNFSKITFFYCLTFLGLLFLSVKGACDALPVTLSRIFPTKSHPSVSYDTLTLASPVIDQTSPRPQIIVPITDGTLSFLDAESGDSNGQVKLPSTPEQQVYIVSTPAQVGRSLIVLYQMLGKKGRESHRLAVINLVEKKLNTAFPILELTAEKPQADGKAMVKFVPTNAFSHSEVKHATRPGSELGFIYAAFGNAGDVQPFHGWLFEIDMDAWKKQGVKHAVNNVLLTTPESQCDVKVKYGTREMICAGGIWTPAGPQIDYEGEDYELLVPTGNGQIDLARKDYANTLMRVKPGLNFDPGCDDDLCQNFKPSNPSLACMQSCKNLFIPRPEPRDKPLKPSTGECDKLTFWECVAWMDYDLGANAPVKIALNSQQSVVVQSGKEGAAYLLDADHLGTMFDRMQLVEICGTANDPCKLPWRGMMVTHPVVSMVNETPVVIFPTFVTDETHTAGLIALKIVIQDGKPHFEPFWHFSHPRTKTTTSTFRSAPTLPVITSVSKHGEVIWVVEIGKPGILYGVRISDGQLIAQTALLGTGVPLSRPVVLGKNLYITSSNFAGKRTWLESYQVD